MDVQGKTFSTRPEVADKKPPVTRENCGSNGGYEKHRRMKEWPCDPCRKAHNEYQSTVYARGKAKAREESRKRKREKALAEAEDVLTPPDHTIAKDEKYDLDNPAYLKKRGRDLWERMNDEYDLDPVQKTILTEVCHQVDALARYSAALSSKSVLWYELGEQIEETGEYPIVINAILQQRDATSKNMAILMGKIGILKEAKKQKTQKDAAALVMERLAAAKNEGKNK